jgi:hypothetical protein
VVLPGATSQGWRVLRQHHIAPDTFIRVMAAHAQHADDDTGRGCTPTVEHIQALAGCSERTVQRARAAARELAIAVEVFRGRHLTLEERIEAYEAGLNHRGWTSVYALGCPLWLARRLGIPVRATYPQVSTHSVDISVDRGTPPVGRSTSKYVLPSRTTSSALRAEQRAPRATSTTRPPPRGQRKTRSGRFNPDAVALAVAIQQRIPTFAGIHPGRLAPTLTRFATATTPWTPAEIHNVLELVVRMKGWTWLSNPQHPAAYLARLLREVEHDHQPPPSEAIEHTSAPAAAPTGGQHRTVVSRPSQERADLERMRQARQAAERAEREGDGLCEHGVGDADPDTGVSPRCAFCRREGILP